MNALRDLLSQSQVLLLGWTLVHFLWEGALVALILSIVLKAMKHCSSESRYAVACGAMVALLVCPLVTLATFGPEFVRRVTASGGDAVPASTVGRLIEEMGRLLDLPVANQLLKSMVGAWCIGVALLLARLLLGWLRVQQVRRSAVPLNCMPIRGRMSVMALRIGIKRPVRLMESALAQGPAVVGFFRPMILLPTAAITGLWPVQIEAILAHELAHIRRHDYLVNLLQSFVETLLFYHPAVWWVSARIREERENCCDDLAVKACGDRTFYAGCLADLDDLRPSPMELAMGAAGGALLWRIRRILLVPDRESRTAIPAAAALTLLMTSGLILAGFSRAHANERATSTAPTLAAAAETYRVGPRAQPVVEPTKNEPTVQPVLDQAPTVSRVAPPLPFPNLGPSSVWVVGGWLQQHWPSESKAQIAPEGIHQASQELRVSPSGDFDQPSDFPSLVPMSQAVRQSNGNSSPMTGAFASPAPLTPDFPSNTAEAPLTSLTGGAPINTLTSAPLNSVTGGPINTVLGGPLMTMTGGPLNTVTGGPVMAVRGGPLMVTTGNPMVNAGPNYPQVVPSHSPPMTVQVRRSR